MLLRDSLLVHFLGTECEATASLSEIKTIESFIKAHKYIYKNYQ